MRIVVTGARGRLGAALVRELALVGHSVTALSHSDLDITDALRVQAVLPPLRPEAILNCSAYNGVDAAQSNPATAFAINARGPAALAGAAADAGAVLVYFSTDFVFDGESPVPYVEESLTSPLNVYGQSKLAGERETRRVQQHYVLRLASLFGGNGVNGHRATVDYIADTLRSGNPVRAAVDRTVSPSPVADVVRATRALLERSLPYGTYHCVASGSTSWLELAREIALFLGVSGCVVPVPSQECVRVLAARPRFCALSNQKLLGFGVDMPTWKTAVVRHLCERYQVAATGRRARIA